MMVILFTILQFSLTEEVFDIGQLDLGEDILVSSGNALCEGQEITLDAGALK